MATQQTTIVDVQGGEEVRAFINQMPAALFEGTRNAFRGSVFRIQETVVRRISMGPLHSRTGTLARSILPKVDGTTLDTLRGRVYSTAFYARIQELGGTVEAKNKYRWLPGGPYLNIPTGANLTTAGVQRMSATDVFAAGGKVKTLNGEFGLYLGATRMFSFAKRVKIPPRLGMLRSAENEMPTLLANLKALSLEAE